MCLYLILILTTYKPHLNHNSSTFLWMSCGFFVAYLLLCIKTTINQARIDPSIHEHTQPIQSTKSVFVQHCIFILVRVLLRAHHNSSYRDLPPTLIKKIIAKPRIDLYLSLLIACHPSLTLFCYGYTCSNQT